MHKDLLEVEKQHFLTLKKDVDEQVLNKIEEEFAIQYAHDAVHIEGKNLITLEEAFSLKKLKKDFNISEREQKEFLNHLRAYYFVKEKIEENIEMTEEFIKDTHQILLEGIMMGGLYRSVNIGLKGQHQPPSHVKVYDRMRRMIDQLEFSFKGTAIERAAFIALTISKIHPFVDGNGRTSRLMLNFSLMKDGYLPISIDDDYKEEYFAALDQFKLEKSMTKMVDLIKKLLLKRYNEVNQKLNEL